MTGLVVVVHDLDGLFELPEDSGGLGQRPRIGVKLLLLLPIEGVEEGAILNGEMPQLGRERVQGARDVVRHPRQRYLHLDAVDVFRSSVLLRLYSIT